MTSFCWSVMHKYTVFCSCSYSHSVFERKALGVASLLAFNVSEGLFCQPISVLPMHEFTAHSLAAFQPHHRHIHPGRTTMHLQFGHAVRKALCCRYSPPGHVHGRRTCHLVPLGAYQQVFRAVQQPHHKCSPLRRLVMRGGLVLRSAALYALYGHLPYPIQRGAFLPLHQCGAVSPLGFGISVFPRNRHLDKAYQMLAEVMRLRLSTLDISILEKTIRMDPSGLV